MDKKRPLLLSLSIKDRISFFKRLALYMYSGVSIPVAFAYIQESSTSKSENYIFGVLEETIMLGLPLSIGLEKFPAIFDQFSIGFIKAAEESGSLSRSLEQLALILAKQSTLRKKASNALIYPLIVFVCTIILSLFLTFYIFPKILPVLKGLKTQLPLSTRILIGINAFVAREWTWMILYLLLLIALSFFLKKSTKFLRFTEKTYMRVPILGAIYKDYILSSFLATICIQLKGSILLPSALGLVQKSLPGIVYPEAVTEIQNDLYEGKRFSEALKSHASLFPLLIPQVISTGESTGTLVHCISLLSQTYDDSLDEIIKNITTLLEPVLMICMGCIVGFVALAIITPIYKVTQNVTIQ